MSVQSSLIMRMLERIPDAALRAEITQQYYQDLEAQSSFVQVRMGELELSLRDHVTDSLGATNEMISDSVQASRENAAALQAIRETIEELRQAAQAGFQSLDRRMTDSDADRALLHERLGRIEAIVGIDAPLGHTLQSLLTRIERLEALERLSNEA